MERWPPDYTKEAKRRDTLIRAYYSLPNPREVFIEQYKDDPVAFIIDWCWTYDPRNNSKNKKASVHMPFLMFDKQIELVEWLKACVDEEEDGLIEKARDMGASWVCCAFSVWLWLFRDGAAIGWGSRKAEYVDKLGDPKTIFWKIRYLIDRLPNFAKPEAYKEDKHATLMKILNPANGSNITGEAGDGIGRGGRTLAYFKDEALKTTANILTPSGWVKNGDLSVGQYIVGVDGLPTKITQIKEFDNVDMYRIKFSDGSHCDASPNHLWTVDKVHGKNHSVTINTETIFDTFKYESPGGQTQYKYRLPLCQPVLFDSDDKLALHPYVVGALLGDGSVSGVPKYCAKMTSVDREIIDNFIKFMPDGCELVQDKTSLKDYRFVDKRKKCKESIARKLIVKSGIAGCRSWEKFIPDAYKYSTPENRLFVLQGLMDTDGSASGNSVTFHSSSKQLAMDVRFIAQSLGGVVFYNVKADHRGFRDMHVLNIAMPNGLMPFRLSRKINLVKRKQKLSRSIVSVEKIQSAKARCISIDNSDGLYITDDFIVTHNSAHYERPGLIEAALGDNTNVQIDISSVNGTGNVFYRRRHGGVVKVMIMDWRDHPAKSQEWYDKRKAKAESEGLMAEFAQEVDRDYAASVEGVIIPSAWVKASIDAHIKLKIPLEGQKEAGLDIADEGGDTNALAIRHGILLNYVEEWGEGDTSDTAKRAAFECNSIGCNTLRFDSVGVGAGVKAEMNKLKEKITAIPYNGGFAVRNPEQQFIDGKKNKDMFKNLKAQSWWELRTRFYKTWRMVEGKETYPHDELISLDSSMPKIHKLVNELSQPTRKYDGVGRLLVDKKPEGTKSPNLADAVVMAYDKTGPKKIRMAII